MKKYLFLLLPLLFSCGGNVNDNTSLNVTINGNKQMKVNESQTLTLSYDGDVKWMSSNNFIARVNDGVVTAYNVGTCQITAYNDFFTSVFDLEVLKDNNINSFSGLLEMLNSFDETSYKEIHYKENKVSSKRTNEEKLYRYDKAYYIEQVETYYVLGNEKFDEAKTYVGIEDNNYFDILISSSSYVRKQEIVDSKPSNNQISLTEAENNLKKSKYINNFFNQFQDAYSGYVKQDKIVVSTNNNVTNFSSFSKNVWSNGINCDYKTFTCDFTFENDNLSSIKYLVNDYGDELFDIENDCLKEGAEPIDVYSMDIDFLIDNSKNECPINPNDYFVSEIKKASYSRAIHVNDYVFSSSINLDEFAPSTALDYSYIDIVSVENLNNQVVLSVEDDTIVALTTGKAKLNIAMKYSSNVIYSLEVEVI
ncbi:unknown [Firmicutes bacterium CAG:449]|nr:unknown [Firmicutes bacterium CAG:449]